MITKFNVFEAYSTAWSDPRGHFPDTVLCTVFILTIWLLGTEAFLKQGQR